MANEGRKQAMEELRAAVKKSRHTYASIGFSAGNTAGWVGEVLRGNYPYYQANQLPKEYPRCA